MRAVCRSLRVVCQGMPGTESPTRTALAGEGNHPHFLNKRGRDLVREPLQHPKITTESPRESRETCTHVRPFLQGVLRVDDASQIRQHLVFGPHPHLGENNTRER